MYLINPTVDIIKAQAVVNYSQETQADVRMEINGNGSLARTLRGLIGDPDKSRRKKLDSRVDANNCILQISNPNVDQTMSALIQSFLLFILVLADIFLKRFNRTICAFFHKNWEKKRAAWLYKEILKRRKRFLQNAKNKIFLKLRNGFRGVENSSLADRSRFQVK